MLLTSIMPVSVMAAEPGDAQGEAGAQPGLKMWYSSPATDWESEASPLGNGFMGAMIFGGVDSDQILINEHTLWSGGPGADPDYDGGHNDRTSEENAANLKKAQELLQDEVTDFTENHSAYVDESTGQVVSENFNPSDEVKNLINTLKGDKTYFGHYQQLSNIMITNESDKAVIPVSIDSNSANKNSGNQQYQEGPEKAFDNRTDTKWYSVGGLSGDAQQEFPAWVTAEYEEPVTTSQYAIVSGNDTPARDPKAWNLYGSNDGEKFDLIDVQTDVVFENRIQTKYFPLDGEVSYKYYKFEVTELYGNAGGCQMQEIIINASEEKASEYTDYVRALDLDTAVASVDYTLDGVGYHREYFVSNPGNVMAVRLTADQDGSITKYFSITTPQAKAEISSENDTITLTGTPSDHGEDGLHFAQQVKVIPKGGEMEADGTGVMVTGADEVLLLMSAGTNYQQCMDDSYDYFSDEDPLDGVKERIAAAEEKGYEVVLATNIFKEIPKELEDNRWINIPFSRNPFSLSSFTAIREMRRLFRDEKFEFVHFHTPVAAFLGRYAAMREKQKNIIYTAHGFHFFEGAPRLSWIIYYPLEVIGSKWTDKLITINEEDYIRAQEFKLRENGKVYKVSGVGLDIQRYQNGDADKLRKEFVACVSHELKTPIAIIQGYAQGLMENVANEEDRNFYCDVIVEESYKMDSLVKELLLISQIESGYFKMNMEKTNIYHLIKEIIDKYSSKTVKIEYEGKEDINVLCDEKYIDRVLDNLISNAIKYRTGESSIKVKVEDKKNRCMVTVSNESENLKEKDLETIWTPFVRLDSAIGKEGHGLGLSIVAGVLENHKSKYGIYLSEGNIVNFWFEIKKYNGGKNEEE